MKNKMLVVIAGLLATLVLLGVVGATGVFAQSSGPTTVTPVPTQGKFPGANPNQNPSAPQPTQQNTPPG